MKWLFFLTTFAPWEVEQLGCIQDFLYHQIQPAYDDVVLHDVIWGSIEVEPAMNYTSPEVQAILSTGLISIYRLVTAKTYEKRHELLYQRHGPDRNMAFLYRALDRYSRIHNSQQSPTTLFTPGWDRDLGPQDAWEWAYELRTSTVEAYRLDRIELRRWGYVLWDKVRLEEISLFKEPFHPPRYVPQRHEVDDEFQATWRARENIARAGGTGYWSVNDQSQVVYPEPRRTGRHLRGRPRVGPTFANAKREFGEASARIEAAMRSKKMKTADGNWFEGWPSFFGTQDLILYSQQQTS